MQICLFPTGKTQSMYILMCLAHSGTGLRTTVPVTSPLNCVTCVLAKAVHFPFIVGQEAFTSVSSNNYPSLAEVDGSKRISVDIEQPSRTSSWMG